MDKWQIEEEKAKQRKLDEQINKINIAAFKQWDNDVMGVSSETMLKQKETQERSHSGDFFRTLKNKKSKKNGSNRWKGMRLDGGIDAIL